MDLVVEEDARRPVELAHDHPLGAVDDEGALVGDDRKLAEIDLLLDDALVLAPLFRVLADTQAQGGLERHRVGQVPLLALVHGIFRVPEVVAHELQREVLARVADREDAVEDLLKPFVLPLQGLDIGLYEIAERLQLNVEKVGDLDVPVPLDLAEAPSLFASNRFNHRCSPFR